MRLRALQKCCHSVAAILLCRYAFQVPRASATWPEVSILAATYSTIANRTLKYMPLGMWHLISTYMET